MKSMIRTVRWLFVAALVSGLAGCSDPQVYGSVGISSGYGGSSWGGSRVHTSISVGGRIR